MIIYQVREVEAFLEAFKSKTDIEAEKLRYRK